MFGVEHRPKLDNSNWLMKKTKKPQQLLHVTRNLKSFRELDEYVLCCPAMVLLSARRWQQLKVALANTCISSIFKGFGGF